jgi:hypothetical protein
VILTRGWKNIALCGDAMEDLRAIFDEEDLEINGYEDFSVMWGIEDVNDLGMEVSSYWNEVLILCGNMSLVRRCQESLKEEAFV